MRQIRFRIEKPIIATENNQGHDQLDDELAIIQREGHASAYFMRLVRPLKLE